MEEARLVISRSGSDQYVWSASPENRNKDQTDIEPEQPGISLSINRCDTQYPWQP